MPRMLKRVAIQAERLSTGVRVYVARDLNVPGLMAHGATTDDAAANLDAARNEHAQLRYGEFTAPTVPQPRSEAFVAFARSSATVAQPFSRTH